MNEKELHEAIKSVIEEFKQELILHNGPEGLIRFLEDHVPRTFDKDNLPVRTHLKERFPEWSEELQEMFDDIDELIDEHQVWRDKADWFEKQGDLHDE